jgi:hypothetical protein
LKRLTIKYSTSGISKDFRNTVRAFISINSYLFSALQHPFLLMRLNFQEYHDVTPIRIGDKPVFCPPESGLAGIAISPPNPPKAGKPDGQRS